MSKIPKNAKAKKEKKAAAPKAVAKVPARIGHNSGKVIPELVKIVDEVLASDERVKNEARLKRDLRNRAKSEFGILSSVLAYEIRMRKLDPDVRVQFESGTKDIKVALGYQPELDFQDGKPTNASLKEQPTEKDLAAKKAAKQDDDEEQDEGSEYAGGDPDVISREG